jgi:hypothetical protein
MSLKIELEWIPYDPELLNNHEVILVAWSGGVTLAEYRWGMFSVITTDDCGYWDSIATDKVTHFMHLPPNPIKPC